MRLLTHERKSVREAANGDAGTPTGMHAGGGDASLASVLLAGCAGNLLLRSSRRVDSPAGEILAVDGCAALSQVARRTTCGADIRAVAAVDER